MGNYGPAQSVHYGTERQIQGKSSVKRAGPLTWSGHKAIGRAAMPLQESRTRRIAGHQLAQTSLEGAQGLSAEILNLWAVTSGFQVLKSAKSRPVS